MMGDPYDDTAEITSGTAAKVREAIAASEEVECKTKPRSYAIDSTRIEVMSYVLSILKRRTCTLCFGTDASRKPSAWVYITYSLSLLYKAVIVAMKVF